MEAPTEEEEEEEKEKEKERERRETRDEAAWWERKNQDWRGDLSGLVWLPVPGSVGWCCWLLYFPGVAVAVAPRASIDRGEKRAKATREREEREEARSGRVRRGVCERW